MDSSTESSKATAAVPTDVMFPSGSTRCSAWHYSGSNGACVVMAAGLGVPKGPGTTRFAQRFHREGFNVVAFDYRRFGDSGGTPRQIVRVREQLEDWTRAIDFCGQLPDVDPTRVALWGFSLSGGHVLATAARRSDVAAAIAHAPVADGAAVARNSMRHTTPLALSRLALAAVTDATRGLLGLDPLLLPIVGERGDTAMLTTPDAADAQQALNPDGSFPDWDPRVAARYALTSASYRPGRQAASVACPLLVLAYDDDQSALAAPAARAAERAAMAELVRLPGGHYEGLLGGFEEAVNIELRFLRKHVVERGER